MTTGSFFSDEVLAETAFDLLTSSTLERYIHMAIRAALRIQSHDQSVIYPERIRQLVTVVRNRWECLLRSAQRDTPEVELAILLCMLAQNAAPEVDELLVAVAIVDRPAVVWVAALARRLLQERASNHTAVSWQVQPLFVSTSPSLNALRGSVVIQQKIPSGVPSSFEEPPTDGTYHARWGDTEVHNTYTYVAA